MLPSTTTKAGSTQAMVHPTIVLRRIPTNSAMNRNHHNRETTTGMRNNNPNRAAPTAAVLLGTLHRLAPPLRMVHPLRSSSTLADPMIRPAPAADPISRPVVHLLQQFQLLLRPFQLLRATITTTATFFLPFSHLRSLLPLIQVSRQRPKSLCPTR